MYIIFFINLFFSSPPAYCNRVRSFACATPLKVPPTICLSPPPHFDSCLLIWFLAFLSDLHIPVCFFLLITDAYKLLYSQEMNLQSALQKKCKSCQVGSSLLWRVYWFLHYLHTVSVVFLQSSEGWDVSRVCVVGWHSSWNYSISP